MSHKMCPICSETAYPYFDYIDFFEQPVSIFKCINCGHGSHDREYTAQQFEKIYQGEYAEGYIQQEDELRRLRQVQYQQDIKDLLSYKSLKDIHVFDYGCSSGDYLDTMPKDWRKSGFEVNPTHIEHVRTSKPHISVFNDLSKMKDKIDLITLRGVIEHIPDHAELIEFIKSHLVVGGHIYISATPDFSSVCSTLYKSHWNQVVCPEHIHQFSSTSLSFLLAKAGMAMHSLSHSYIETPYADWDHDKTKFINNFNLLKTKKMDKAQCKHAFAGNMISALFERVV